MDIVPLDLKLNLCISILEFKYSTSKDISVFFYVNLCISILEFKYRFT